jgi:CRISPR-associated endonuclease/helicase Cas3
VVTAHHGGLSGKVDLKARLREKSNSLSVRESLSLAKKEMDSLECAKEVKTPGFLKDKEVTEFFIRMLFSCLVDADYLDTESFFEKDREKPPRVKTLSEPFMIKQNEIIANAPDMHLNKIRKEVYDHCMKAAEEPAGMFKLTVPTGGGKTRSSLGFAIAHAMKNNHDRIICAIPHTSIIEQTATVFRDILGKENVLEHHSGVHLSDKDNGNSNETPGEAKLRLASENWGFLPERRPD